MNREEFMTQLSRLLMDLPESERQEALRYYSDYFDEAGPENESNVIRELGSPGRIAASIKANLKESGWKQEETYSEENRDHEQYTGFQKYEMQTRHRQKGAGWWTLVIIALIFASPVLLGVGGGLLGVIFGILGAVFGICFAFLGGSLGCIVGGVGILLKGIYHLVSSPVSGIVEVGGGFICLAIGIALMWIFSWFAFHLFPRLIRTMVTFVSKIFHRGKEQKGV